MASVTTPTAFRLEKELVAVLRQHSGAMCPDGAPPLQVLAETQIGTRIADLLLIYSKSDRPRSLVQLTYFDCALLAAILDGQPIDLATLADRLYAPAADIETRVGRLVRLGLVTQRPDGPYALRRGALPGDLRIVAVEAKLSRWREALSQAEAYFSFANESYIAMPSSAVRQNISALDACATAGVGVIAVDAGGAHVILDGERRVPRSAEWVRLVSSSVGVSHTAVVARPKASRHAR